MARLREDLIHPDPLLDCLPFARPRGLPGVLGRRLNYDKRSRPRVLLPQTGQGSVTLERGDLAQRYTGVTLFVRPHFRFDSRTPAARHTRRGHWFWAALESQRFVYRDVLAAAALETASRSELDARAQRLVQMAPSAPAAAAPAPRP